MKNMNEDEVKQFACKLELVLAKVHQFQLFLQNVDHINDEEVFEELKNLKQHLNELNEFSKSLIVLKE